MARVWKLSSVVNRVSCSWQVAAKVDIEVRRQVPEVTEVLVHLDTDHSRSTDVTWITRDSADAAPRRAAGRLMRPLILHADALFPHPSLQLVEEPARPKLMMRRSQSDIEHEVRATLAELPEIWGCTHVRLLWDSSRGGALVQADVIMDPNLRVIQAMRIGANAKRALETLEDVLEADMHLELQLLAPCGAPTSHLVDADVALPEVQPPVATTRASEELQECVRPVNVLDVTSSRVRVPQPSRGASGGSESDSDAHIDQGARGNCA